MFRATISSLLGHKLRLALTAVAIVLGVAFVTGTYVLTDTLGAFFDGVFHDANAGVDAVVRPKQDQNTNGPQQQSATLPESLVAKVRQVPGVAAADGGVGGYAQLTDKSGKAVGGKGPPTLGFSWSSNTKLSPLRLKQGGPPRAPDDVVIDAVSARKYGYHVGDNIRIFFLGPARTFRVAGIAGFGKADNLGGATIASFEQKTAERVLGVPGQVQTIGIAATPGVSNSELISRIRPIVPPGAEVVSGQTAAQQNANQIKTGIGFLSKALLFFAGIALFVGSFIVANTFAIVINQRTRELGLLRALGATGRQVMWSVMIEAGIVGLVASGAGFGVGLGLGVGLRALVQTIGGGAPLPGASLRIEPRTIIVSIVVGVAVTMISAIVPARRAARLPAIAAMRDVPQEATIPRRRTVVGSALLAGGAALLAIGLFGHNIAFRFGWLGLGAAGVFLGVSRLSPFIARPVAGVIGAPLPSVAGVAGTLARNNAGRNPARTAATAAALMVGLGLVGSVAVMGASLRTSIDSVLSSTLKADYVVQAKESFVGFGPEVLARVRTIEDRRQPVPVRPVRVAVGVRHDTWKLDGKTKSLASVDATGLDQVLDFGMVAGSESALVHEAVLVEEQEARKHHYRVGSIVPMDLPRTGVIDVPVGGIYKTDQVIGDSYVLDLGTYRRGFFDQRLTSVFIKVVPGTTNAEMKSAFAPLLEAFPNIQLRNQADFAQDIKNNVRQIVSLVNSLLALAIVIALLGIANTLALSIFERTRELGLLRAVGMTRRQVRRMVRLESVIIGVFGSLLGVAVGLLLGIAIVKSLTQYGITNLSIPGGELVVLVIVAGIAGWISAAFPARRAARVEMLSAVAFE
jgi:putative ABC transport system permease protein